MIFDTHFPQTIKMKKDLLNMRKGNNPKHEEIFSDKKDERMSAGELSGGEEEKDVQISHLDVDENQNIDDYKKKIDEQIEEIKKKLIKKYQFTKTIDEDAIRKHYETGLKECLETKKRELEDKEVQIIY